MVNLSFAEIMKQISVKKAHHVFFRDASQVKTDYSIVISQPGMLFFGLIQLFSSHENILKMGR